MSHFVVIFYFLLTENNFVFWQAARSDSFYLELVPNTGQVLSEMKQQVSLAAEVCFLESPICGVFAFSYT